MSSRNDPRVVERWRRADGLVVLRQSPPPGAASFSATYVGPAGYGFDPPGQGGVALLTSQLLSSGAAGRRRIEVARELDRRGATLQARCHPESAELTVWGPVAGLRPLLGLLADAVLRPTFAPADVDRGLRQLKERQLRERSQPDRRAEAELFRAVFPPGHPYRETGTGNPRSLTTIRGESLRRFHRAHYTPDQGLVVVTHPSPLGTIRREVDRLFRDFAVATAPPVPSNPQRRTSAPPLQRIELPGRAQVEIRLGGSSIPRSSDAQPAAFLANEILGGRPLLSRLFQKVREAEGLAYHASSELESMRWGGYWYVEAGTGPERSERVLAILRRELGRLRSERVRTRELDTIRESAIGEIPLGFETTAGAHDLALDVGYHDLPDDFYRRWPDRLRAIGPSEIRGAVETALDARLAATVIAGPSST